MTYPDAGFLQDIASKALDEIKEPWQTCPNCGNGCDCVDGEGRA